MSSQRPEMSEEKDPQGSPKRSKNRNLSPRSKHAIKQKKSLSPVPSPQSTIRLDHKRTISDLALSETINLKASIVEEEVEGI